MDLTWGKASNRQTELPQPSESFLQTASPRLWWWSLEGVCAGCSTGSFSCPSVMLPGHQLSMTALMGWSHEWRPPSTALKLAPLPSWLKPSYHRFCQATPPSGPPSPRWPAATPPALCRTLELLRVGRRLSSPHAVSSLAHLFRWQSHNTQPQCGSTTRHMCLSLHWFESVSLKRSQPFKSAHNLKMPQQMKWIMCYVLKLCKNLSLIQSVMTHCNMMMMKVNDNIYIISTVLFL